MYAIWNSIQQNKELINLLEINYNIEMLCYIQPYSNTYS